MTTLVERLRNPATPTIYSRDAMSMKHGADRITELEAQNALMQASRSLRIEDLEDELAACKKRLHNAGRYCMSEFDCIEKGIDWSAYERGVSDAINVAWGETK